MLGFKYVHCSFINKVVTKFNVFIFAEMDKEEFIIIVTDGHFPLKEDEILLNLINLQQLQQLTEKEFPLARTFKRIGFDD